MGLRSNHLGSLIIGAGQAYTSMFVLNPRRTLFNNNTKAFGKYVSIPSGYQSAVIAWIPSRTISYNLSALISGDSSLSSSLLNTITLEAAIQGLGTVVSNSEVGQNLLSTLIGNGTVSSILQLICTLQALIDAGARPSAFDIAQEVWQAKQANYTDPTSLGYILANQNPAALADLIMNDPRFLSVAVFLGLK